MNREQKALYEAKARVIKALAHPTRLWMVERLAEGERWVCELYDEVDADFSTVSRHLAVLRQAGVVDVRRQGKQMFYRLNVPCVLDFMGCIEAVLTSSAPHRLEALGMAGPGTACNRCVNQEQER